jgi:hypothetical protein
MVAARRELAAIAGVAGDTAAGQVLAGRLMRRLAVQGGPDAVTDPVGWLLVRGLPRRADCGDLRCDEGLRMDTGGPCETCASLVADRRGLRQKVAADLPHADQEERRAVYEQRLRERVAREAELAQIRRKRRLQGPRGATAATVARGSSWSAAPWSMGCAGYVVSRSKSPLSLRLRQSRRAR